MNHRYAAYYHVYKIRAIPRSVACEFYFDTAFCDAPALEKEVHLQSKAVCRPLSKKKDEKARQTMEEEISWKIGRSRGAKTSGNASAFTSKSVHKRVYSFMHFSSVALGNGDQHSS